MKHTHAREMRARGQKIIFILRNIPLDMEEKATTIGAQSGKKWRTVVRNVKECREVDEADDE
jgi:hypothetical protein